MKPSKGKWLPKSPVNKRARCDRDWNHIVQADMPRLQVYDMRGPDRVKGNKSKSSYLCTWCAYDEYGTRPPVFPEQMEMDV